MHPVAQAQEEKGGEEGEQYGRRERRGGSEGTPLEIPVVDASDIDTRTLWARDAQELSKLQLKLEREGYRMEWEPRLYSGRLNDGRQVVVPVHNVALKSVGL